MAFDARLLIGIAGIGAAAVGIGAVVALSRRDDAASDRPKVPGAAPGAAPRPEPGPAPTLAGTPITRLAADYFTRYDHNGDGAIDLTPKPYDELIQLLGNVSIADAGKLAETDERVTNYRGDATGDKLTLVMDHDLRLLMRAAQNQAGPGGAELGTLQLRQSQLEREIAGGWDANGDQLLQPAEEQQLQADYPLEIGNFRFIRVLHLGEWRQPDDGPAPG